MNSKNILMITPGYYPTQGGVQVEIHLLVNELINRGYNITLVTKTVPGTPAIEKSKGLHIYRMGDTKIQLDPWNSLFFIRKNMSEIKKIIREENIDLIHVHHFDLSFAYASSLKKTFKLPIISTVHGSFLNDREYLKIRINIKEPFRWILRILPGIVFEKKSIQAVDYLICVSKDLEILCKRLRNDDHVITIPNAIRLQQFNPSIRAGNLSINGFKILCPGRISPEKGQIYLIDALKIVREKLDSQVILMGSAHANTIQGIKKRIQLLNLEEYVHLLPARSYDEIPPYYKAADLIVIPSLSESFGLAILENMALGNVVVASNVGGIPDLIEHGKTGLLVPPGDPQKLAEAILLALTDKELREKIKKNAAEKAKEYDIEKITDATERCYQKPLWCS